MSLDGETAKTAFVFKRASIGYERSLRIFSESILLEFMSSGTILFSFTVKLRTDDIYEIQGSHDGLKFFSPKNKENGNVMRFVIVNSKMVFSLCDEKRHIWTISNTPKSSCEIKVSVFAKTKDFHTTRATLNMYSFPIYGFGFKFKDIMKPGELATVRLDLQQDYYVFVVLTACEDKMTVKLLYTDISCSELCMEEKQIDPCATLCCDIKIDDHSRNLTLALSSERYKTYLILPTHGKIVPNYSCYLSSKYCNDVSLFLM